MNSSKNPGIIIGVLSVSIPLVVAVLLFLPQSGKLGNLDLTFLPHLNGVLNFSTSLALITGFYFIKNNNIFAHRVSMLVAFSLSSIFLVSYVLYHFQVPSTHFGGEGLIKYIYYILLISHILLAIVVVPLVLFSIYFGVSNQISKHMRIVKYSFPVWLYVAVTGVLVYLLISPYYA